jgi:hypothetical protein
MRSVSLRDLFGGPIDPDLVLAAGNGNRRLKNIIPLGRRLDDVGNFRRCVSGMTGFVRVRRNDRGVIEETERGYLLPGHPILEYLLSRDPPPPPPPSYVPVTRIVEAALKRIHRRWPRMQPLSPGRQFDALSCENFRFLDDLNRVHPTETKGLAWLALWGNGVSPEIMREIIREAREEVAAELGIDLNAHDTSLAWWMNRRRTGIVDRPPRQSPASTFGFTGDRDRGLSSKVYDSKMRRVRAVLLPWFIGILFVIVYCMVTTLWL